MSLRSLLLALPRSTNVKVPARIAAAMALACLVATAAPAKGKGDGFDRAAALDALSSVEVAACKKKKGPTGEGHIVVTFDPAGGVSQAVADAAPFAGTKVGKCVEKAYKKVKIPAFKGEPVNVGKKFRVE